MKIENIKMAIIENGGITLEPKTLNNANLKTGYMVSLKGYEIITTIDDLTINALIAHARIAHALGGYIGLWLSKGKLYIDVSINENNLLKALQLGYRENQFAIYDIVNDQEIRV